MARVPTTKPQVSPTAGSTPFQRGPASGEAFGASEAHAAEERARAGIRISEALKAAQSRIGRAESAAVARTGAAKSEAVNRIGAARANAVTGTGRLREDAIARVGTTRVGAASNAEQAANAAVAADQTGAAIVQVGQSLSQVGEDIAAAAARIVVGEETLERVEILGQTKTALEAVVQAEIDEGTDFRTKDSMTAAFEAFNSIMAGAAAKFANQTPEGQQLGLIALEKLDFKYKNIGTTRSTDAKRVETDRVIGEKTNEFAAQAGLSPGQIGPLLIEGEAFIAQFDTTSSPVESVKRRSAMFSAIVRGGFESQIFTPSVDGANIILASKILGAHAGVLEPEVLRQMNKQLSTAVVGFENSTGDQFVQLGKNDRLFDKSQLDENGNPTLVAEGVEGLNLMAPGVKAVNSEGKTIAENPLPGKKVVPLTPLGKINRDLIDGNINDEEHAQLTAKFFEENPDSATEATMRKELIGASKRYLIIKDSWQRISSASTRDTGVSDLTLIFSYMKLVEPESSVREGEFATASNTGGLAQSLLNQYNKAKTGEFLTDPQRAEFVALSKIIFDNTSRNQLAVVDSFSAVARNTQGVSVDNVILRYLVPSRKGFEINDYFRDLPDTTRNAVTNLYNKAIEKGIDDFTLEEIEELEKHQILLDDVNDRLSRANTGQ